MEKNEQELQRYIDQTLEVRALSSPLLDDTVSAEDYRLLLIQNFIRIGEIAQDNNRILKQYWFPLIWKKELLTEDENEVLHGFRVKQLDAYRMDNLDLPLLYRQSVRLLRDAEEKGDDDGIVGALDEMIESAYAIMSVSSRVSPVNPIVYEYRDAGLRDAEKLLDYLEHDRFVSLNDHSKALVLINARYISALFHRYDSHGDPAVNTSDLNILLCALQLCDDPFYRQEPPGYDWVYHRFRTLQYITNLLHMHNGRHFPVEQCRLIHTHAEALYDFWNAEKDRLSRYSSDDMIRLALERAAFFAGRIDAATYKARLIELYHGIDDHDTSFYTGSVMMLVPMELFLLVKNTASSADDDAEMAQYYHRVITYIQRLPKKGAFSFLLSYLGDLLLLFQPSEAAMDFEAFCLSLMAAIHPPTYVHTLSVAELASCIAGHLIRLCPDVFTGIRDTKTPEEVTARSEEIVSLAYHAALSHDFGKLFVAEEIMTYGRALLDEEFELIKSHTQMGAYILRQREETREYADVALYHHKWYDDSSGYPENVRLSDYKLKAIVAIITCADCLDAATDAIGRSYKSGKTVDEFMQELQEGSGTRYAPYLYELFQDASFRADIEEILSGGRKEHYRKAYRNLASHQALSDHP